MTVTSISLLDRAREDAGSDSWDQLVAIYSPLLRRWAERFEIQSSDADDLVQEVLVAIARELPEIQHSGRIGAFRSWIRTMLVHRLQNHWRSRNYRPSAKGGPSILVQLCELEDASSGVSRMWDSEHDRHVLSKLLTLLRPRFQENTWQAFERQMIDGQSPDVVAKELEMPIHSVYVAKSRVLNAMRNEAAGLVDSVDLG